MHGALATILQHDLGPFATNNARLLTTGTVDDIGNSKTSTIIIIKIHSRGVLCF